MDDHVTPQGGDQLPEKITIGGAEYDANEAAELIGLAKQTRELEAKYNTKFDSVWPEYGRLSQEHKTLKTQYEQAQQDLAKYQNMKPQDRDPEDIEAAKAAARKLGIILNDDLEKAGYVRKDDLDKYFDEKYTKTREREKAVEAIMSQADKLEKELSGEDGRPKFVKKHVLAYASAYQMKDLKAAYEDMYADELKSWGEAQAKTVQKPGMRTITPRQGAKQPIETPTTGKNLRDRISESLWVNEK